VLRIRCGRKQAIGIARIDRNRGLALVEDARGKVEVRSRAERVTVLVKPGATATGVFGSRVSLTVTRNG
jgi:hypothetical protein